MYPTKKKTQNTKQKTQRIEPENSKMIKTNIKKTWTQKAWYIHLNQVTEKEHNNKYTNNQQHGLNQLNINHIKQIFQTVSIYNHVFHWIDWMVLNISIELLYSVKLNLVTVKDRLTRYLFWLSNSFKINLFLLQP